MQRAAASQQSAMLVYPIGRTYLIELLHSELQARQVRFVDGPASQRAYAQLERLETEMRETGVVYSCPPGQHETSAYPAPCWPGRRGIRT